MKLVILGATGPSGQQLVVQALETGHDVTAIVRDPNKLTTAHENLKVVIGDVFSSESLQEHMTGHDVVMSCLGSHVGWMKEVTLYSESIKVIVEAMRAVQISKLIAITSICTTDEPGPFMVDWVLKPLFLKKVLKDMGVMESYLMENCQDINFTVVKPPGLTNAAKTDTEIQTTEGQYNKGRPSEIARADVARFMLECLNKNDFDRKFPAISY